jgi:hypothetical protein
MTMAETKKLTRTQRLEAVLDTYDVLRQRLSTTALDMTIPAAQHWRTLTLREGLQEEVKKVEQELNQEYASAKASDFEDTATSYEYDVTRLLEVSSVLEPVADLLAHDTRQRLLVLEHNPLEVKARVLGHELVAADAAGLKAELEAFLVTERAKHADLLSRAELSVAEASDAFEVFSVLKPSDLYWTQFSGQLHDLKGALAKASADVHLSPVEAVLRDALGFRSTLEGRVSAPEAQVDHPVRRGVLVGAPVLTLVAVLLVLTAWTPALLLAALAPLAVSAAVLVPKWLKKPAAPASAPLLARVRAEQAPLPWTESSARFLANRLERWEEALGSDPARRDAVKALVTRARDVLLSGTPLTLDVLVQDETKRFVDEHLPAGIDAYVRLTLLDDSVRAAAEAEFDALLASLTSRLASLTRTSETSALEELRVQTRFQRSFEPSSLDLDAS